MSLPLTYRVAQGPAHWPWDRMGLSPLTNAADQRFDARFLDFRLERRFIVGYVCQDCVARGVAKDDCRGPEWEWSTPSVEMSIPHEVEEWMRAHAAMHRERERLEHEPLPLNDHVARKYELP